MSRTSVRRADLLRHSVSLLLCVAIGGPLSSLAAPASDSGTADSASPAAAVHSDEAAVRAIRNVVAQSGGEASWQGLRSAEESFSVLGSGETTPHVMMLLDDWSLDSTRYRRGSKAQSGSPKDHNGSSTFLVNTGTTQASLPEFDQATSLVGRLPAAAAEVMLRRAEYVLKISKSQFCQSDQICIDVFRIGGSAVPLALVQQWKVSVSTGLPITVRYQAVSARSTPAPIWKEVKFLQFATEDGVTIPVSIAMNLAGRRQLWTFVSLVKNLGFDIAKFDQEVAQ